METKPVVTLTFTLPDNQSQLDSALDGTKMRTLIEELMAELHSGVKYGEQCFGVSLKKKGKPNGEMIDMLNRIREFVYREVEANKIRIEL